MTTSLAAKSLALERLGESVLQFGRRVAVERRLLVAAAERAVGVFAVGVEQNLELALRAIVGLQTNESR